MVKLWTQGGPGSPTPHPTYQDSSAFGEQPKYMEPPATDGYANDLDALSDAIDTLMQGEELCLDVDLDVAKKVRPTVHKVKEYA